MRIVIYHALHNGEIAFFSPPYPVRTLHPFGPQLAEFSGMIVDTKKDKAHELYVTAGLSQAGVSRLVGVSRKTVSEWVKSGEWEQIRLRYNQTPMGLLVSFEDELSAITERIAARPEGERYPSYEEARVRNMVIKSINELRSRISAGPTVDVLAAFLFYLDTVDRHAGDLLSKLADKYIENFLDHEKNIRQKMPGFRPGHQELL